MKIMFKEIKRLVFNFISYVAAYSVAVTIANYLILKLIYQWWKPVENLKRKRRELPPACLNDHSYGEHSYIQIKNIKLHYVESGDQTKPLLLLLHGFPEFWFSWRHQLKYFSKHYWTVAVDMRGFGDSEKPVGVYQYKMKYLISDIKNLIHALGRDKCILVGHDWGSIVGWYFLFKYPEMVDKYVMIGTCQLFTKISNWKHIIKSWYIYPSLLPYFPEWYIQIGDFKLFDYIFRNNSEDEKEAYKFVFGKPGALSYPMNYYKANVLTLAFPPREKAKDVQLPKGLLIYTDNDKATDVNFKNVKNIIENLDTVLLKSATHFIHQFKHEETNKIIAKFLDLDDVLDPGNAKSVRFDDCKN